MGVPCMFQYISCYSLSRSCNFHPFQSFVSIHLMLLFIKERSVKNIFFQEVSIHLMLLFICFDPANASKLMMFQYISCYSLSDQRLQVQRCNLVSIHLMLLFIGSTFSSFVSDSMFQYISCYSLSSSLQVTGSFAVTFQYISCYSLSGSQLFIKSADICFNTSHVTLYLGW